MKYRFRQKVETEDHLIEQLAFGSTRKKGQERRIGERFTIDEAILIAMTYVSIVSKMRQIDGKNKDIHTNDNENSSTK